MKTKQDLKQWIEENSFSIEDQAGVKMVVVDVDELKAFTEHSPDRVILSGLHSEGIIVAEKQFKDAMQDHSKTARKPITVALMRDLISDVTIGRKSFSRMVEILNEKAINFNNTKDETNSL